MGARTAKLNMKKLVVIGLGLLAAGALSAHAGDAKEIWTKECAKCHGADGKGDTKMGQKLEISDLTSAKVQGTKDEELAKAIKEGIKKDGRTRMKAFTDLSEQEVKDLVAYIHGLKK
jgi:mono/diheme cytochrome c family protein